jgi:lysophospholipid acyltransferase (LPLAT)-like uncharacterized protein
VYRPSPSRPGPTARLVLAAAAAAYRLSYATLRLRGQLSNGSVIQPRRHAFDREVFAVCERDALALGGLLAGAGVTVLVTIGRDGDRAAYALERLGCTVVRGSSRAGGALALRTLVDHLEASPHPAAIVVDGPLGPAGVAKGGAVVCAAATARPLRALAASASRALTFPRTWSGIYLPLPFSRVTIATDDPLTLPWPLTPEEVEAQAAILSDRLRALREGSRRANICAPMESSE